MAERVTYTAYGRARHHWFEDVDGDGDHDTADLDLVRTLNGKRIQDVGYRAEADLDRDGDIDRTDYGLANSSDPFGTGFGHAALAEGVLSSSAVDNVIGWDGYVFNPEVETYTVRFRTYSPTLGRWLERDPAGYVDGMHMYEYVRSQSLMTLDPTGLFQDPGWVRLREIQMLEELKDQADDKEQCGKKCRHFIVVQWPKDPDRVNKACWALAHPYPGDAIEGTSIESAVQEILNSLGEDECICSIQFWSHGWNGFFKVGDERITAEDFGDDSKFAPLKDRICRDDALITVGACRSFNTDTGRDLAEAMAAFFQCRVAGYTETIGEGLRYPGYVELCPGQEATWPDGTGKQVKPKPKGKDPKDKTPSAPAQRIKPCCPSAPPQIPGRDTPGGPRV